MPQIRRSIGEGELDVRRHVRRNKDALAQIVNPVNGVVYAFYHLLHFLISGIKLFPRPFPGNRPQNDCPFFVVPLHTDWHKFPPLNIFLTAFINFILIQLPISRTKSAAACATMPCDSQGKWYAQYSVDRARYAAT